MWLMVGYVYLLTPLETLPSPSAPPFPEAAKVTVKESLHNRAQAGDACLLLETVKSHYQLQEPVVVVAHLSGLPRHRVDTTLASLLIEGDIQVLGPISFYRQPETGEYIARITRNPASGMPLGIGSYKVVVRVGPDLVAAVPFEVSAQAGKLAWRSRPVKQALMGSIGSQY